MTGIPRRHHYVTKSYLEGFLEPGEQTLWCYGRKKMQPFRASPDKLANIRDFHSFRRADGTIDFSLETLIDKEIESPGMPVIRKLTRGKTNLDFSQRWILSRLIALQNVRVPYERDFLDRQTKESLMDYINDMDMESRRLGKPVNAIEVAVSPTDQVPKADAWVLITRAFVENELRAIEADPGRSSRDVLFTVAADIAKVYVQMEWTIFYIVGTARFITSDCPVVTSYLDGRKSGGIKDPHCEVTFPLSCKALLRMKHPSWLLTSMRKKRVNEAKKSRRGARPKINVAHADDAMVRHLNEFHADQAHLWAFSGRSEGWLLDRMQRPGKGLKRRKTAVDLLVPQKSGETPARMTRKRELAVDFD